jgi:putative ABC transport system ATP-binding protein
MAIVGESGVGKSLLDCMAALHLEGVDLGWLTEDARAALRREKVGFMFQAFYVLPHLDVAQNVGLSLLLLLLWPRRTTRGCKPCCTSWA